MPINVVLKRTFRINGKEYGDREEIPPEQHEAVENAIEAVKALTPGIPGTRVVANGKPAPGSDRTLIRRGS